MTRSAISSASAVRVADRSTSAGLGRGIVLGGHQHLGRLLGDLASHGIDTAIEEGRRVGAAGPRRPAIPDGVPEGLEPGETLRLA